MSDVRLRDWVLRLGAAEAVGMTAAAAAARLVSARFGEVPSGADALAAVGVIVGGGLVEGLALGLAGASLLAERLDRRQQRRWVATTLVVAGLGWALASIPGTLGGGGDGAAPPILAVLAGAAALGLGMGALLGAAQARVLRGSVSHPRRWIALSAGAWTLAMPVVFPGAVTPGADWSIPAVLLLAAATGASAGALLGLVCGVGVASLDGPSVSSRIVLALLDSRVGTPLRGSLIGLRYTGVRSGRTRQMPVMAAATAGGFVVVPGRAERKVWWHNLRRPAALEIRTATGWQSGIGRVLLPGDHGYADARAVYATRYPKARFPDDQPVVVLDVAAQAEAVARADAERTAALS